MKLLKSIVAMLCIISGAMAFILGVKASPFFAIATGMLIIKDIASNR